MLPHDCASLWTLHVRKLLLIPAQMIASGGLIPHLSPMEVIR